LFSAVFAQDATPSKQSVAEEITRLEKKKAVFSQRARYAEKESDRLISIDYFESAQLAYEAKNYQKAVEHIDQRIQELKKSHESK
jgi:hypothetical protein